VSLKTRYLGARVPGGGKGYRKIIASGLRAFGVDYSGASGSPCLVAVVDRIPGPNPKRWEFCTSPDLTVKTGESRFELAAPNGASLNATLLSPATCPVTTRQMTLNHEINCVPGHHASRDFRRTIISANGTDFFFAVTTIQRGPAPGVSSTGTGEDIIATVGRQTVRFDGKKLLFGVTGQKASP
jgi:hypothetical protein